MRIEQTSLANVGVNVMTRRCVPDVTCQTATVQWPRRTFMMILMIVACGPFCHAQSPWERAANNLATTFTGPLARSLALVAIVLGGLMFMYGEQGAKRQISGIVFGGGLALFAAQFLTWLF